MGLGQNHQNRSASEIMRKVKSRDTQPEVALRKSLWSRGIRYNLCSETLPGKPDIVLLNHQLAIFVDGDYWHGGQWTRRHFQSLEDQFSSVNNKEYWSTKIRKNMHRDCLSTAALLSEGWKVLRLWESEIKNNLNLCIETILSARNDSTASSYSLLPEKTFAEFFAGIGLVRMALARHGWRTAYANDIDPKKREMYESHFRDTVSLYRLGDIHSISPDEIPSVTLATASFPCNDLSLAGARSGLNGRHSSAFWGFIRIIEGMASRRPPLILLENVTGFLTSHGGQDFREALLALNSMGYSVDTFVIDARAFVPQSRQRLFVVGVRNDTPNLQGHGALVEPQAKNVRPSALIKFMDAHRDIQWNIKVFPNLSTNGTLLINILDDLPDDSSEWWSRERSDYLLNQMSPRHRKLADRMISGAEWSFGTIFRRVRNKKSMAELRTDGVAGCLRTPRGGSGRQILFKAGHGRYMVRLLTARECARLMGADDYHIEVPLNQALFGFGDAVCVPVIEWIAQQYLNPVVNELLRGRILCPLKQIEDHEQKRAQCSNS